jgi:competence protein ComEA
MDHCLWRRYPPQVDNGIIADRKRAEDAPGNGPSALSPFTHYRRLLMNPFTESTVARPWAEKPCTRFAATVPAMRAGRRRRSLAGLALGVLAGSVSLHGMALAIDVNAATQEQLRELRGIGPKTAQIIIEERTRGGRYESLNDLSDRVKGIGPKKAAALQASGLTVGSTAAPGQSAAPPGSPATRTPTVTPGKAADRPAGKVAASSSPLSVNQRPRGR